MRKAFSGELLTCCD
uniref:Uncharacterized protein n=1 Tax=Arundo donax TaxID=35708 RepID=A0A0A9CEM0_ARUDO